MVDNSQGHCAYGDDALIATEMNWNPACKQPCLRDGWFTNSAGEKIAQPMVFPADHPTFLGQPKGIKQVLLE